MIPLSGWTAIESAGGPLLLLARAALPKWSGYLDPPNDYARACAVESYVSVIRVDDHQALVLGDMPMPTMVWPSRSGNAVVLVRWLYGPSNSAVVEAVSKLDMAIFPPPELSVEFYASPLVLFDSACPGDSVNDSLTVRLPAGKFQVSTLEFKPADDISLILHWVRP